MKKAILSGNVDIKEGVIFVKEGQFYQGEVLTKYPHMFSESKTIETLEPVETSIPVVTPITIETPVVEPIIDEPITGFEDNKSEGTEE